MIRPFALEDIGPVAAFLKEDASENPWDENGLLTYFMRNDTLMLVAEEDGEAFAFAALLLLKPEGEILDVTVRRDMQRRGTGRALCTALLMRGREEGIRTVYLEVRESNAGAIALYEELGFETYGRRRNYYTDPVEDALVMKRTAKEG